MINLKDFCYVFKMHVYAFTASLIKDKSKLSDFNKGMSKFKLLQRAM